MGERPFECYRKGIGHFLGRRYNLPLAYNGHRQKVERWRGPIEICFSRLLLITMTWRPFRARRPGGRFPGLKPWAKILSPSGAINYPKSCLSSRHSAQGFGHASDLLKVCARSAATCLLFNCRAVSSACMYIDSSCQGSGWVAIASR